MPSLPLVHSFEGGSDGTSITALNSVAGGDAFTIITGTLAKYATTAAMHDSLGLEIVQPATPAAAYVGWGSIGSLTTQTWGRCYFQVGNNTLEHRLFTARDSASAVGFILKVTNAGKVRAHDAAGTAITGTTSTTTIAANTWYRLEWSQTLNAASSSVTWWLYLGDSATLLETKGPASFTATTNYQQALWGNVSGFVTGSTTRIDDVALATTGPIGPVATAVLVTVPTAAQATNAAAPAPLTTTTILPAASTATTLAPAPGVTAGRLVSPPAASASAAAPAPAVAVGLRLLPPAAAASGFIPTPTVTAGGAVVTPPPPIIVVTTSEPAPTPPPPLSNGSLGCGGYDAWILPRGGGQPILTQLPVTAGEWHRGEDQTTTAKVTLSGLAQPRNQDCCRGLRLIHTYQHELALVRDDGEVWVGTLVSKEASGVDEVTLTAMDLTVWFSIRVLHEKHVWADADLSVIFNDAVEDGMRPDPSPNLTVSATTCGITDTRTVLPKERVAVSSIIGEIARIGIDYTAYRRTVIAGGTTIPTPPFATLTDEHLAPQTTTEDGLQQANLWYVLGEGGRGNGINWGEVSATGFITRDGLIERVVKESGIKTQRAAKAAARTRLRATENPPVVIDGGRLLPDAPVAMSDLVPGRVVGLSLSETCVPVVDTLRLATVDVTFAKQQGGAYEENVDVTFQPLGTLAGEVAEE